MDTKHTPTPWIYLGLTDVGHRTYALEVGASTVYFQKESDAIFTHRAVNAHEGLLEALKILVWQIEDSSAKESNIGPDAPFVMAARQAIAKAEGK